MAPCTKPVLASVKTKRHGSSGLIWNPRLSNVSLSSWYQRYGALTSPYADLSNSQISCWPRLSFLLISSGGSIPKRRLSLLEPLRNAVLISKLLMTCFLEAQSWSINALVSFWRVGESLGMSVRSGSSYPNMTRRALAFLSLPSLAASIGSRSFHVSTQRHLRMFFSGILCRRIDFTVSVAIHWSISLSLACWNSCTCWAFKSFILTSTRCRLAAAAAKVTKESGADWSSVRSSSVKNTEHSNPWFSSRWRTSSRSLQTSLAVSMIVNMVTPVQGSGVCQWSSSCPQKSVLFQRGESWNVPVVLRQPCSVSKSAGQSKISLGSNACCRGRWWTRSNLPCCCTQKSSTTRPSSSLGGIGTSTGLVSRGGNCSFSERSFNGVVGVYSLFSCDGMGLTGSASGCSLSEVELSICMLGGFTGRTSGSVSGIIMEELGAPGIWGGVGTTWSVRSSYWNTPFPRTLCGNESWSDDSCSKLVLASLSDSLRTCSGATLYRRLEWDTQMTCSDSWMITRPGPCHCPGYSPFPGLQNMTNVPLWKCPRWGRWRLKKALRNFSLWSAWTNASRALSRRMSCCRNSTPSGESLFAKWWDAWKGSSTTLAGKWDIFPRTRISGVVVVVVSGDNLARPNWPGVKPPTPGPSTPQEGQARPPHQQCEDPNCSDPCQKAQDGSSCVRLGLCTIAPGSARIVSHEQGRPLQDPSLIC